MTVITAFLLVCLAVKVTHADKECQNAVICPCGSKGENVTICAYDDTEVCTRLSKCEKCEERSAVCSECPVGFEGPLCSQAVIKTCENPGPISNGNIRFAIPAEIEGSKMKILPVHTVIEYFCNEGYRLQGPQSLTCNPTGLWSAEVPTCIKAISENCENPGLISNGKLQFSHPTVNLGQEMKLFPLETVLEYSCNEGYRLQGGASTSTCKTCPTCTKATWNKSKPSCNIDCGRGFFNYGPCRLMNCNKHTPWVVSISVEDDNGVNHVCLGALLNHQTVLTAAHCLVGHSTFIIEFGKHHLRYQDDDPQVIFRRSSRTILHPNFSNMTFDSNIGLLFFQPKIRFTRDVQPICLPTYWESIEGTKVGRTGIVSVMNGIENAFSAGGMSLVRMTVMSDESCLEANEQAELFITKNSFCAGNKDDFQAVCGGDSGAPLFFYDRFEGRFILQSIVSFRTRDCPMRGNHAVFTKLANFLKWIEENFE